jgi:hypothetical protein
VEVFKLARPTFALGCWQPHEIGATEPSFTYVRWGTLMAARDGVDEGVRRSRESSLA